MGRFPAPTTSMPLAKVNRHDTKFNCHAVAIDSTLPVRQVDPRGNAQWRVSLAPVPAAPCRPHAACGASGPRHQMTMLLADMSMRDDATPLTVHVYTDESCRPPPIPVRGRAHGPPHPGFRDCNPHKARLTPHTPGVDPTSALGVPGQAQPRHVPRLWRLPRRAGLCDSADQGRFPRRCRVSVVGPA